MLVWNITITKTNMKYFEVEKKLIGKRDHGLQVSLLLLLLLLLLLVNDGGLDAT